MPENNLVVFEKDNFKPDDYVKELVQECVGGPELLQRKTKILNYRDEVSSKLKKHVYEHYMQFIDTAKEISHLESEMYQLSHILIEQRNLLNTLREESLLDEQKNIIDEQENDPNDNEEQQNKKSISLIQESLMGYTEKLTNKIFIHEGGIIELDSNDYRPICRVHIFLLNDLLILAKVKQNKKLEFLTQYDTKKIAVINIKDLDGIKNAINVITADGSRIFQCINQAAKLEWIDKFEIAIKFNQQSVATAVKSKKGKAPQPPTQLQRQKSLIETKSITSDTTLSPSENESFIENYAPDWLASAPEEIQAEIAQRHFEDSLILVQKCEEYILKDSTFYNCTEINDRIKSLKSTLSTVLLQELSSSQSRSLQATLRSCRRAVKLLVKMGKGREACGILLRVCSSAIRSSQRQARSNNLGVSELFFCDLAQVASEFLSCFITQTACTSSLVVWCNIELQYFASQLIKHYLTKGTQLEVIAKCVENVREPCAKLTEIGLDLSYHMEGLLRNQLEQLLEESRCRLIETIGRTEELWQPYNLQTKTNLKNLLKEFDGLDINLREHITGDTWINLTQTTVNFCRHFLSVTDSCAILAKNESLAVNAEMLLRDLFKSQYNTNLNANANVDLNFIGKNKNYLCEVLLSIAMTKFQKICGRRCDILMELQMQLRGPPKPKPRSVYKTDVL